MRGISAHKPRDKEREIGSQVQLLLCIWKFSAKKRLALHLKHAFRYMLSAKKKGLKCAESQLVAEIDNTEILHSNVLAESPHKILSCSVAAPNCAPFFQGGSNAWHGGTPRDKIHPCPRIRPSVPLWERKESWKSIRASIFPNFICPSKSSLGFAVTIRWGA